jgi:2,3-bisphosphoglycerate-dependent phosphoglycerate mutase
MAHLILVRHGKSEWNEKGLWTGWNDVDLHEDGYAEARRAAEAIRDIELHQARVAALKRTRQTFDEIVRTLDREDMDPTVSASLNERDYGIHAGKNKWQVKEEVGDAEFQNIRRGWDHPIPEGERLVDVYDRVVPYYQEQILPRLREGKNVLVVSHGNTLRALAKHLEGLDEKQVCEIEIGTGEVHCYSINSETGEVIEKNVRKSDVV